MVILRAPWSVTAPLPGPLTSLELLLPMLNGVIMLLETSLIGATLISLALSLLLENG